MKRFFLVASMCMLMAVPVAAQSTGAVATVGQMVHDPDDKRLGHVDKVLADGSIQIIFDDTRIVTIPGSTLSVSNDELHTSMTKQQVGKLRS